MINARRFFTQRSPQDYVLKSARFINWTNPRLMFELSMTADDRTKYSWSNQVRVSFS